MELSSTGSPRLTVAHPYVPLGSLALTELRNACRIRTSTLCSILTSLTAEGTIRKTTGGYAVIR